MNQGKMFRWLLGIASLELLLIIGIAIYTFGGRSEEAITNHVMTEAEVMQTAQECFEAYRVMEAICLEPRITIDSSLEILVNGASYYEVTDEQFPNLNSIKEYVTSVCTEQLAAKLYRVMRIEDTKSLSFIESDGKLYRMDYIGFFMGSDYEIPVVSLQEDGTKIVLVYRVHDTENADEVGKMTLVLRNGKWYADSIEEW